ncbi:hypothetical protein ACIBMX_44940 [Streptomyces phaeochromogenes]|uniref:hypothetical protein n=1 Tax=Streptomyces phaeochromogenes TaxID=1923 RepID=UPI0033DC2D99
MTTGPKASSRATAMAGETLSMTARDEPAAGVLVRLLASGDDRGTVLLARSVAASGIRSTS